MTRVCPGSSLMDCAPWRSRRRLCSPRWADQDISRLKRFAVRFSRWCFRVTTSNRILWLKRQLAVSRHTRSKPPGSDLVITDGLAEIVEET